MKGLDKILTVQAILTVAIVGVGAYYFFKKRNESKAKKEELVITKSSTVTEPTKMTREEATTECLKSMQHIRMTQSGKDAFIAKCVEDKLK